MVCCGFGAPKTLGKPGDLVFGCSASIIAISAHLVRAFMHDVKRFTGEELDETLLS